MSHTPNLSLSLSQICGRSVRRFALLGAIVAVSSLGWSLTQPSLAQDKGDPPTPGKNADKQVGKQSAPDDGWARNPDTAKTAARTSGKPILVVTCWKSGICHSCDTWRSRVPVDKDVQKQLARFELVQWNYDGLGGKVITWTKEHGGESDDPNVQAFVVAFDGRVLSRADERAVFTPAQFGRWLAKQSSAYEKDYPRTRLPLVRANVTLSGQGTTAKPSCAALATAQASHQPILLYVGHGPTTSRAPSRAVKAEIKSALRFEKDTLNSKTAAAAAKGWTLLRIDRSKAADAALAASFGVTKAPAIVLLAPRKDGAASATEPKLLDGKTSGASLAHQLKKLIE